jgi:tetratricopeptide (TPR) repeat protein
VGLALLLGGCATTGGAGGSGAEKAAGETKTEKVNVDPMLVRGGEGVEGEKTLDSKDVFDRAYEAYSARRFEKAAKHYRLVVKHFPDSRFYYSALYNGGLAFEKVKRWESAAEMYRRLIDEFPKKEDTKDAYYRLARVYQELGGHQKIVELMTEVLLRDGLSTFDRIEAYTHRSKALLELGELEDAKNGYNNLLKLNRQAPSAERLPSDSRYISQAYFGLGKVYHRKQSAISLKLPPKAMGEDLDKKGKLLLEAQKYYLQALRQHHPEWSVAAGYMIGRLYEDFYSEIFSAEIPKELTEEHIAMYFEELRKQIRPLMKRAIDVYEKNLSLSRRIGETPENNKWVAETSESMERMKEYLNNPVTQKRAQKMVREGRDFRDLWEPWEEAEDRVHRAIQQASEEASSRLNAARR